jgi:hypothetical protein
LYSTKDQEIRVYGTVMDLKDIASGRMTPDYFAKVVREMAAKTALAVFESSTTGDSGVTFTCEPSFGVHVTLHITPRMTWGKDKGERGVEVRVTSGSAALAPADAALLGRLLTDAAFFAGLVEATFRKTTFVFKEE